MDRTRLIEAQKRNRRLLLCREWKKNGIEISLDNFLDKEIIYQPDKSILSLIHKFDEEKKYIICNLDTGIEEYKILLKNNICKDVEYIFEPENFSEIGLIKLSGKIILENIEFIIKNSSAHQGILLNVFIYTENLEKGICLWRLEYDTRIYVW